MPNDILQVGPLQWGWITVLAALIATPAMAADLAVKAPVAAPSVAPDWSGFYLGVHAGYGWGKDRFTASDYPWAWGDPYRDLTNIIDGVDHKGGVFGGQAGYNWQFGSAVAGLEIDLSFGNIKGSKSASVSGTYKYSDEDDTYEWCVSQTRIFDQKIDILGSARARLGWAWDWALLYGTGGLAWERLEAKYTETVPEDDYFHYESGIKDKFGWVVGVGAEAKLFGSNNWITRVEYLHYDFGKIFGDYSDGDPNYYYIDGKQTIDLVRAGLSYKFGYAAPVMARY
jgi:outer membrane immunogenic protein